MQRKKEGTHTISEGLECELVLLTHYQKTTYSEEEPQH